MIKSVFTTVVLAELILGINSNIFAQSNTKIVDSNSVTTISKTPLVKNNITIKNKKSEAAIEAKAVKESVVTNNSETAYQAKAVKSVQVSKNVELDKKK